MDITFTFRKQRLRTLPSPPPGVTPASGFLCRSLPKSDSASAISAPLRAGSAPSLIRLNVPILCGEVIGPGTAKTSRPCCRA